MHFDGFWDEDQATRVYRLGTRRPDLLTAPEAQLYKLLSESIVIIGRTLDLPTFRAAFNDGMVDKSHLEEAANAGANCL